MSGANVEIVMPSDAVIDAVIENAETRSDAVIDAVIENAQDQIDHAQEVAADIAEAAMATEIGRRVSTIEQGISTWQQEADHVKSLLQTMELQIQSLSQQVTALTPPLVIADISPSTHSTLVEQPEVLAIVEPETLQEAPPPSVEENPAPAKKVRRWI